MPARVLAPRLCERRQGIETQSMNGLITMRSSFFSDTASMHHRGDNKDKQVLPNLPKLAPGGAASRVRAEVILYR